MKKIIIISVISIFLVSCSKDWCYDKYPIPENNSSSYIETANIDTIYLPMPADTVKIQSDIDCPDQKIIYKDGKTEYKVVIKDKILTVYRIGVKDSLRVIYAYKNTDEYKKQTEVKIVKEIEYKTPKIGWYSYGLNLLLLIWVTRKIWIKFIKF